MKTSKKVGLILFIFNLFLLFFFLLFFGGGGGGGSFPAQLVNFLFFKVRNNSLKRNLK